LREKKKEVGWWIHFIWERSAPITRGGEAAKPVKSLNSHYFAADHNYVVDQPAPHPKCTGKIKKFVAISVENSKSLMRINSWRS